MYGVRTCVRGRVRVRASQYTHSTPRGWAVPRCAWAVLRGSPGRTWAHLRHRCGEVVRREEEAVGGVAVHVHKVRVLAGEALHAPLELLVRALSTGEARHV